MTFDSSAFGEDAIGQETREFVAASMAMREQMPSMANTDLVDLRRLMDEGGGAFPVPPPVDRAEDRAVPGMGEGATVRIIRPEGREPTGVYLDIHGGGWVIGRARMSDQANLALVDAFGLATVSVDYRLAPEHPYPAPPDDCEAAAAWLVENAAAEFGTERLLIGGGSAGAHLTAVTLLRLRDRHGYTGFLGANLVYGVYDLSMTPSQRLGVGPEGGLARDDRAGHRRAPAQPHVRARQLLHRGVSRLVANPVPVARRLQAARGGGSARLRPRHRRAVQQHGLPAPRCDHRGGHRQWRPDG